MKKFKNPAEAHYHRSDLFEEIISRLKELKVDLSRIKREDIAAVDEFHVRGAQVSKELADSINISNAKLLDVGCGIGGPSRMLSDEYGCEVTGIDLSEEFVRTATKLSDLLGFSGSTKFVCGDATEMPFDDETFDVVWTQHVQMNISDKMKFYAEIHRVLNNEGIFLYYDIFKQGEAEVNFPMPWANEPDISFLAPVSTIEKILQSLNFKKIQVQDQTNNGITFFENLLDSIKKFGAPILGLNVLMGASTKTKIINLLNGLKEGKIVLQSGVYRKYPPDLIFSAQDQ